MRPNQKLYVVSRQDLHAGPQAVQGMHALTEFSFDYPEIYRNWYRKSNHLCFLSVADEDAIHDLCVVLDNAKVRYVYFCEPDMDMTLTALAIEPTDTASVLLKDLPLALKTYAPVGQR